MQRTQVRQFRLSLQTLIYAGVEAHPNKMRFKGVLTRVDEASTKPPNGAHGHRIYMSSEVAKKRLHTLVGMGLNYSPSLDTHAQRRKVGVISKAWIDGKNLWVEGTIWKHDFPEAEKDLKQDGLGMSMEIGDVYVEDPKATVWNITDCCFLGGTILYKDAAAYHRTQAIAAKAAGGGKENMPILKKNSRAGKSSQTEQDHLAEIVAAALGTALLPIMKRQTQTLAKLNESQDRVIELLEASVSGDGEDEEEIEAAGKSKSKAKKDGEEEDDNEDNNDDDGDGEEEDDMETRGSKKVKAAKNEEDEEAGDGEEEVDAADVDEEDTPGHANKGARNHGDDTEEDDDLGPDKKEAVTGAAVRKLRTQMQRMEARFNAELSAANARERTLKKQLKTLKVQVNAASADTNRRSLTPEMVALLSKANINADDIRASGSKLGVSEMDAILAQTPGLDTETKIALKNKFVKAGLMDEGHVSRIQIQ